MGLLVNVDVPDLAVGSAFYTELFGLCVGRRFAAPLAGRAPAMTPAYFILA